MQVPTSWLHTALIHLIHLIHLIRLIRLIRRIVLIIQAVKNWTRILPSMVSWQNPRPFYLYEANSYSCSSCL